MPESQSTEVTSTQLPRRHAVPVVYVRGTHYDVGFDTGRIFASLVKTFLSTYENLREFEAQYATPAGRAAYDATLAAMTRRYPHYVRELQGIAEGAEVPFYKIFLLHLDDIIGTINDSKQPRPDAGGCTSIGVNNPEHTLLGHNEDAFAETLNNWYILSAHVTPAPEHLEYGATEERFSSLCYAGQLPGYTMGFTDHGLVFSINTLSPLNLKPGGTPRTFITRALLAARNFADAERILLDEGLGAANGFSINMVWSDGWGSRRLFNAEVAPERAARSQVSVRKYDAAGLVHANIYQRLPVTEVTGPIVDSSEARLAAVAARAAPAARRDVAAVLSDTGSHTHYQVYQDAPDSVIKTIATGIFDLDKNSWSIYTGKPNSSEPVAVLPLQFFQLGGSC